MKNLSLAAVAVLIVLTNATYAQCNKSGGSHHGQPVYRPAPVLHHEPVRHHHHEDHQNIHRRTTSCSIKPTPAYQPIHEVAPIPPRAPAHVQLPEVAAGQKVTIDGRFFGPQPGQVAVRIGGLALNAQVVGWTSTQVTAVLPQLPLAEPVTASVVVLTASGNVADQLDVTLVPATNIPAMPASAENAQRPIVTAGQNITLEGVNLGNTAGQVQIVVSGLTLNAQINNWTPTEATALLPSISFDESVQATVRIVKANGQLADQIDITFAPNSQQVAAIQ